jgi:four helix bundle protein
MPPCIICDRAFLFAARIVKLCDSMATRGFGARHIASQLMHIGANAEEAQEGQTKRDFIAKMSISRKEARETI